MFPAKDITIKCLELQLALALHVLYHHGIQLVNVVISNLNTISRVFITIVTGYLHLTQQCYQRVALQVKCQTSG